ncbi:hypothetical protein DSM104440_00594 [Usitatibacter palustris]|uniref:DUF2059 domain-containing protein n=1 Tax=Usitatibacter palustris TaxID=2732487 RepID=A0A6M4H5K0_9PROT|nr:hypothetical protein DSM104440_00594 [Usitatibacter palustris]
MLLAGLLAVAATAALAQPATGEIDRLLDLSGFNPAVIPIAPLMNMTLDAPDRPGPKLDTGTRERLRTAIDTLYSSRAIRDEVHSMLAETLQPGDVNTLTAWFDAPHGRRFVAAQAAHQVEFRAAMDKARDAAEKDYLATVSAERMDRCRRISEAGMMAEFFIDMMINIQASAGYAIWVAAYPDQPANFDTFRRQLESERPRLVGTLRPAAGGRAAYALRPLSDADIESGLALFESPAGRRFTEANLKGLNRLHVKGAVALARQFQASKAGS